MKIGFAGMSHLGLNSSFAVAGRGMQVLCFDSDAALVHDLRLGKLPIFEPGLEALYSENRSRISFTSTAQDLQSCDVVYISLDVKTNEDNSSDLAPVQALIDRIRVGLTSSSILVILCQVPPGFTRRLAPSIPCPVFYQVETLIFGRAVERACHPERTIIGCPDPSQPLPPALDRILRAFDCPILPMRYESAELAKISINFCLVSSISVANTLAEVCENIGADWSEIVPALKLDRRIGQYSYLSPGLGIAGGNLERDLVTVLSLAAEHGTDACVVQSWISNHQYRRNWALRRLNAEVLGSKPDARITVLGLAYKEETKSTKNSPSLGLIEKLQDQLIRVFDPQVRLDEQATGFKIPRNLTQVASAEEACQDSDVILVMTPWKQFASLDWSRLAARMRGRLVIDPYAILEQDRCFAAGLDYLTLGRGPDRNAQSRKEAEC